jgi:hypothetical protein
MGDTLMTQHRLHFLLFGVDALMLVKDRAQATGLAGVQVSEQEFGKVNRRDTSAANRSAARRRPRRQSAVNWEAEKLYDVESLGPFDDF